MPTKKADEKLLEEELEKKLEELGIAKMQRCDHNYKYTTVIRFRGVFFKIKRVYTCTKCGAIYTVTWCEHK
jgi:hypothetical protein